MKSLSLKLLILLIITILSFDKAYAESLLVKCTEMKNGALEACTKLIDTNKADFKIFSSRGNLWGKLQEYDKAISDYDQAIKMNPKIDMTFYNRGFAWAKKGFYDKAIVDYSEAIKLTKRASFYDSRGAAWHYKGEYKKAISDFNQAINLSTSEGSIPYFYVYNRALAWNKLKDYNKALNDFNLVLELKPGFDQALFNRGVILTDLGLTDKAIEDFNQVIKIHPKMSQLYVSRAYAWNQKEEFNKALDDYNQAIVLEPSNGSAYFGRGAVWANINAHENAIRDYNKALTLKHQTGLTYCNRGLEYYKQGLLDESLSDYNDGLTINKDKHCFIGRGNVWRKKGELNKATDDLLEAVKLDSKDYIAFYNLGSISAINLNYEKALLYYTEAIKINPKLSNAYFDRGLIWQLKGNYDKAITDFNEVIKIDPSYGNAQELIQLMSKKRLTNHNSNSSENPNLKKNVFPNNKRLALIIGNSEYKNVPILNNPIHDAKLIADSLKSIGFDNVDIKLNLNRQQMLDVLNNFEVAATGAEWALIYYAGHGFEIQNINYMVPVDAMAVDEKNISSQTVNMQYFLNSVQSASKLRLLIIDACRNNPMVQLLKTSPLDRGINGLDISSFRSGLARIEPDPGTLVVYSAKAGEYALDGDGDNSPFVEALSKRITEKPALEVRRLFDYVREDVVNSTQNKQTPFAYGSLSAKDDFYFLK